MCTSCLSYTVLISKETKINSDSRVIDSLRGNVKGVIFNRIYYNIMHPKQSSYWCNTSDIELMSVCLIRNIIDNQIQWNKFDYDHEYHMILNGKFLLEKFNKLVLFV